MIIKMIINLFNKRNKIVFYNEKTNKKVCTVRFSDSEYFMLSKAASFENRSINEFVLDAIKSYTK